MNEELEECKEYVMDKLRRNGMLFVGYTIVVEMLGHELRMKQIMNFGVE